MQRFGRQCKIRKLSYIVLIVLAAAVVVVYRNYDPSASTNFFPKCPFRQLTGYQCPGCGSQRAVHQLLNFNVKEAFAYNPLLVISIPYLLLGVALEKLTLSEKFLRLRKALFGAFAIKIVLVIIILFWIGRNINF